MYLSSAIEYILFCLHAFFKKSKKKKKIIFSCLANDSISARDRYLLFLFHHKNEVSHFVEIREAEK